MNANDHRPRPETVEDAASRSHVQDDRGKFIHRKDTGLDEGLSHAFSPEGGTAGVTKGIYMLGAL